MHQLLVAVAPCLDSELTIKTMLQFIGQLVNVHSLGVAIQMKVNVFLAPGYSHVFGSECIHNGLHQVLSDERLVQGRAERVPPVVEFLQRSQPGGTVQL